jgi:hypothetical protein
LRAHVGRSGCRNGTWFSSEPADFLVNRPKPRSRAMNPQKHNPRLLRCRRSSTAKSCCGTIPAPSAAPVARACGIPDQQRLRCLRRRFADDQSGVAEGHRARASLTLSALAVCPMRLPSAYEMVREVWLASWAGSAWARAKGSAAGRGKPQSSHVAVAGSGVEFRRPRLPSLTLTT